ncbi:MAG: DUF835 domain-containing protein [Thermococcus sp.]|nr:DUF835 domain-containing protein [Thermococcus sp.]
MYQNIPGALAGAVLTIVGLHLIWMAFNYYKGLEEPRKSLARRFLVSAFLFTMGALATTIDSLIEARIWFIMAIFYVASYMILVVSVGFHLKTLQSRQAKPSQSREKVPILPISGAYAFRKPASPKGLAYLSRFSSGLLVVSRTKKELWVKEHQMEPDGFIWLSGVEGENAIGPTKLHVLQGTILRFLKERGKKAVVYFEGIEYLTIYNDFSTVAKFLFLIKDHVISNNSVLILYLPPGILDKAQESILLKEFKEKREEELIREVSQKMVVALTEGGNHAGSKGAEGESGASEEEAEKA